jgi:drug/metabolite transporter (DMT)-like permease
MNFKNATILALSTMLISGFSNFIAKIAVTAIKDPIVFTTLKNALVGVLLAGLIIAYKKWPEIKALSKKQLAMLMTIGFVGGFVPFALFFTGLARTSALNGSLIHKTLFLWVFVLAVPLLKEKVTKMQWLGAGLIFGANLLVGGFQGFKFNMGELMILGATILWAIENVIAKKALKDISALTVSGSRMILGSIMLFGLVAWQGNLHIISGLSTQNWSWIILTSALLSGYVLTWYSALKLAPATYVATLLVPATLVTNILSAVFITHSFSFLNTASGALYITGTFLVIYFARQASMKKILPATN